MLATSSPRLGVAVLIVAIPALLACDDARELESPTPGGRVVLTSYDGLGADLAWRWIEDGVAAQPEGLAAMAREGLAAGRLRMVDPTLTAVNHVTLVTGKPPVATGIVSNGYFAAGDPLIRERSGYAEASEAEALWSTVRRQNRRVGVLVWPGSGPPAEARMGDFGVAWPTRPLARSEMIDLDPAVASSSSGSGPPSEDGLEGLEWTVTVELGRAQPGSQALRLTSIDSVADGRRRFDAIALRVEGEPSWSLHREGDWRRLDLETTGPDDSRPRHYGSWAKILTIDPESGRARLYRGEVYRLEAYPGTFEDRLDAAVGPWPGPPDGYALGRWWVDEKQGIDLGTFLEQAERLDRYLDAVLTMVVEQEPFDLLFAYHPITDEYLHAALVTDPSQAAWTAEREMLASAGLERVGRSVDASIAATWAALDPARDVLAVVSDHGQLPIHHLVHLNRLLADAGLLEVEERDGRPRIAPGSQVVAAAHGANAHLYLNLVGERPEGVVAAAAGPLLLERVASLLTALEDRGEPIVEQVLDRGEAAALGFDHPNGGDLVAFLRPGYAFGHHLRGHVVEPSSYHGQHGYLAHHDGMAGIFFARGAGVGRERPEELRATEVAARVAGWAGIPLR